LGWSPSFGCAVGGPVGGPVGPAIENILFIFSSSCSTCLEDSSINVSSLCKVSAVTCAFIWFSSIFDYWIHLGRLEFYEAIDIAQRFGDNELLLFAFLRQEAIVRADPHMPGSEKVTLLSYIESRITALQRDRDAAEELMDDNDDVNEIDEGNEDANGGVEDAYADEILDNSAYGYESQEHDYNDDEPYASEDDDN